MIKIFGFDISKLSDNDFMKLYKNLNPIRKERADHIKDPKAKRLSIAAGALLQYAVSKASGLPVQMIKLDETENGKPYAKNVKIHFNLTHTENLVLCAVSDNAVGIDAEKKRFVNVGVAQKYFTQKEREYISENKLKEVTRFFEIWTKKEAYVKMLGTGVRDFLSFDSTEEKISTVKQGDYIISVTSEKFPEIEYVKNSAFN